jgi:hypothetical protein
VAAARGHEIAQQARDVIARHDRLHKPSTTVLVLDAQRFIANAVQEGLGLLARGHGAGNEIVRRHVGRRHAEIFHVAEIGWHHDPQPPAFTDPVPFVPRRQCLEQLRRQ